MGGCFYYGYKDYFMKNCPSRAEYSPAPSLASVYVYAPSQGQCRGRGGAGNVRSFGQCSIAHTIATPTDYRVYVVIYID
ncbi:hypothetical protein V6N13_042602 [Hibiscus sabdariffa]|uniref:Uncharacterized protein n=1 Tax=Hibiscus sabdariffa TaxID=183260 RepID=A0ABR1ZCR0_9ROSI